MIPEQMTADNIEIDRELLIENDYINAYISAWFDVDARFGTQTYGTESYVNVYANYFPEGERLEVGYTVIAADGSDGGLVPVEVSDSERDVILAKLRETGLNECVAEMQSDSEFECVELFGDDALFTSGRVERSSLPEGLYAYDLRHDDYGELCTIERHVAVNHFGTVITREPLDFGGSDYIEVGTQINFVGETTTLDDFAADTSQQQQFT